MAGPASTQTFLHQIAGQIVDQVAQFHQRNEGAGQHQRAVRLAPAHQNFRAAQLAGTDVDDRLVVRNEFAGLERLLDLGHGVTRGSLRDEHDEAGDENHDHPGGEEAEPFEIGMLGGNARARAQDFDIETELVGFDVRHKIRADVFLRAPADFPDNRALPRHDTRIAAEWTASGRDLRKEQRRRHQCSNCIGACADLAAQPHHALAGRQLDDVEPVAGSTDQQLRREHCALAKRQAEMGAQRLRVGADDRDFLDWNRDECGIAHRFDVGRITGIDAARCQTVQRSYCVFDASLGERDCAPGGGADLRFALPIDETFKPEIKANQWNAGEQCADDDRKNIPARDCAHKKPHPDSGQGPLPGARIVSHGAVKTTLSLRSGKPNSGANCAKRSPIVTDGLMSQSRASQIGG